MTMMNTLFEGINVNLNEPGTLSCMCLQYCDSVNIGIVSWGD